MLGCFRWLGAWWAGFLLFAIILVMLAPFFCMYPKSMSKTSRYSSADKTSTVTPHSEAEPTVNPSAVLSAAKIKGNKRLYYPYPRT